MWQVCGGGGGGRGSYGVLGGMGGGGGRRGSYRVLVERRDVKRPLERLGHRRENNIKIDRREVTWS